MARAFFSCKRQIQTMQGLAPVVRNVASRCLVTKVVLRHLVVAVPTVPHLPVRRLSVSSAPVDAPAATTSARQLYPPRTGPGESKSDSFARLVARTIESGETLELKISSPRASWHILQALASASSASEFKVTLVGAGEREIGDASAGAASDTASMTQGRRLSVRFLARKVNKQEQLSHGTGDGCFVSNGTQYTQLAKKLAIELRRGPVLVHTYADAEQAMESALKALAMAPTLGGNARPLRCTTRITQDLRNPARPARIMICASQDNDDEDEDEFLAFPPGAKPDPDALRQFQQAVSDRIGTGDVVGMECRGRHASSHAVAAMARVQGSYTAEFAVRWVDGFIASSKATDGDVEQSATGAKAADMPAGPVARALRIRASRGPTWESFNSTDFRRADKVVVKASASVKAVARRIGSQVTEHGAVAVHTNADDAAAIYATVKALASVPIEYNGLRVACVPSFGLATTTARDGESGNSSGLRLLRLYVRRAPER